MNLYFYWYFTFFSLYQRYSKDRHFDVFATGFFSLFSSCLFFGIIVILLNIFKLPFKITPEIGGVFFGIGIIVNYLIFLSKQRQQRLYKLYKENQSAKNDIIAILLSIISIVLFILAVKGNQNLNK